MRSRDSLTRRRLWATWIATFVLCATAILTASLYQPLRATFLGIDVRSGLALASYTTTFLLGAVTIALIRALPKRGSTITVKELRKRAGHRSMGRS